MKDSYYFPHDYHARHDPKLERLRMELGAVSDGIFWDLIEMLYEEGGYLAISDVPLFSKILNTPQEIISKVIKEAFINKDGKFYNISLLKRLKHINLVRRERANAGKISGQKRNKCLTKAKHLSNNIKESKGKESKVNKRKKKIVKKQLSDLDFLNSLKTNPIYSHINIETELAKMDVWLSTRPGRKKTRRFIVNWINKVERPVSFKEKEEPRPDPACHICKGKGLIPDGPQKGGQCLCVK